MILSFAVYSSDICVTVSSTDNLHCSDYFDFEACFKVIFFDQILSILIRLSFI